MRIDNPHCLISVLYEQQELACCVSKQKLVGYTSSQRHTLYKQLVYAWADVLFDQLKLIHSPIF